MPANDPLGALKSYLFPTLLSGFTLLVWNDIREIKQDVKALMTQSSIDKTRIDAIEKQMDLINSQVFRQTASTNQDKQLPPEHQASGFSKEGIREEEFNVKKYLISKII